jgi:hypothetical protein
MLFGLLEGHVDERAAGKLESVAEEMEEHPGEHPGQD